MNTVTIVDEALRVLVNNGVINSPDYWRKTVETVIHQDQLFINMANALLKK